MTMERLRELADAVDSAGDRIEQLTVTSQTPSLTDEEHRDKWLNRMIWVEVQNHLRVQLNMACAEYALTLVQSPSVAAGQ